MGYRMVRHEQCGEHGTTAMDLRYLVLLFCLVGLISVCLYGGFLSGKKFYAYTDVGIDTYSGYWPAYSYFADVYKTGEFCFWNFEEGLGSSVFTNSTLAFDPFILMFIPFDKTTLPFVLVYAAVLKILLAAFFFYMYLSQFAIQPYSKMIGALLYAFNGYMIFMGQHYHAATLMVFLPAYLYLYERLALRPARVIAFMYAATLAAFLVFCIYYVYMVCLLMPLYIVLRWLSSERGTYKDFIIRPALFSCIGAGLGAALVFPTLYVYLTCPRVSGSLFDTNIFSLDSVSNYYAVLVRFFSNNADYSKHLQWYEPVLYCGLLTLVVVPQIVWHGRIRNRLICGLGFCIVCAALVFPYFRIVMNGFSHTTYRWSFFLIVCAIAVGAKALDHLVRTGQVHKKILTATACVLCASLAIVILRFAAFGSGRDLLDYMVVGILIGLYCAIFLCLSRAGLRPFLKALLIVLVALDLVWASYRIVNDRETVSPDIINNRQGYYDYTADAVAYLQSIDEEFYRIDRSFMSVFLRDSLAFRYRGVQAYNSMNHPEYLAFLQSLDIPFLYGFVNNIAAFWSRQNLQTLVGVKYFFSRKGHAVPFGYEHIHTTGDINIFKNRYALPLGFAYDAWIDRETFSRLEKHQQDESLLKAYVHNDKRHPPSEYMSQISARELTNYCKIRQQSVPTEFLHVVMQGVQDGRDTLSTSNKAPDGCFSEGTYLDFVLPRSAIAPGEAMFNINMTIDSEYAVDAVLSWRALHTAEHAENSMPVEVRKGFWGYNFGSTSAALNHYALQLDCSGEYAVRLVFKNPRGRISILKLDIAAQYPQDMTAYMHDIRKLRQQSLTMLQYGSDYLQGEIEIDRPKLLFLSIPYDKGWHAQVNGRRVPTEKVNIGFTGIYLDRGHSTVEMRYVPPWMQAGKIVSVLSVFFLIVLLFLKKPRMVFNR